MDLGAKLKLLREHAGHQRGLGRPLTQSEVASAIRQELGGSISQSYLSQLERGQRLHMTHKSREQLARFFDVHPGFLVSDLAAPASATPVDLSGAEPGPDGHNLARHTPILSQVPGALGHPQIHHILARLAVHPRRSQIWHMVDALIDLPDDEFHQLRTLLGHAP